MKTIAHSIQVFTILVLVVVASQFASAQNSSIELTCRSKAKEIATETYKTCVTESKQAQIEKIRNDYQAKLKDLKEYYDVELRKVSGKAQTQSPAKAGAKKATPVAQQAPARGVTHSLPTKEPAGSYAPLANGANQRSAETTAVITQEAPAPMSVELRPNPAAQQSKEVPYGFEDETVENPIAE